MKRIFHVAKDLASFVAVAALCGGSANVRYGRSKPEVLFVAELAPVPGDALWIFAKLLGETWIAVRVDWHEGLWPIMAANGVQPADLPPEVWAGSARWLREINLAPEPANGHDAVREFLAANPATLELREFDVSA